MNEDRLRWLVVAGVLGYVAVGNGLPQKILGQNPSAVQADYTGPLKAVHDAAARMKPEHRAAMAEAFEQASRSIRNDTLGLIGTTGQWQRAMQGVLQFGYRDGGRVDTLYPDVAAAIQQELSIVTGPDDVKIADRARFADCPLEISKAVR